MFSLLAQHTGRSVEVGSFGIADVLIWLVILAGCVGIAFIVLRVCKVNVPQWVWQIIGIVVAVFVGVVAIRFLLSM